MVVLYIYIRMSVVAEKYTNVVQDIVRQRYPLTPFSYDEQNFVG